MGNRLVTVYRLGPDETLKVAVHLDCSYPDVVNEGLATMVAGFTAELDVVLKRTRTFTETVE